eukprot:3770885-Rhodomonas_salina.1
MVVFMVAVLIFMLAVEKLNALLAEIPTEFVPDFENAAKELFASRRAQPEVWLHSEMNYKAFFSVYPVEGWDLGSRCLSRSSRRGRQ